MYKHLFCWISYRRMWFLKRGVKMKWLFTLFFLPIIPITGQDKIKDESTDAIIERLGKNPAELTCIEELAKRPNDPRVIPTLREQFVYAKQSGATGLNGIRVSHFIAAN